MKVLETSTSFYRLQGNCIRFLEAANWIFHAQKFHAASPIFQAFIRISPQIRESFQSNIKEIKDIAMRIPQVSVGKTSNFVSYDTTLTVYECQCDKKLFKVGICLEIKWKTTSFTSLFFGTTLRTEY